MTDHRPKAAPSPAERAAEPRFAEPNLAPTAVKRQHYVPRAHLRRFTDANDRLLCFDLDTSKSFGTAVENAAVGNRYYDLSFDDQTFSLESWLTEIETAAGPVIERLVRDPQGIAALSDSGEFALARFVAAQFFRVPAFRDWNEQVTRKILTDLRDMAKQSLYNGVLGELSGAEADEIWASWEQNPDHWWFGENEATPDVVVVADMLEETQGWANLLRAKPWRIGNAADASLLYTSDNPVAPFLTPVRPWWEPGGMATLAYWVPLSPDTLLVLGRMNRSVGERSAKGPRNYRGFSRWEVSFSNHLQSHNATRHIFGTGPYIPRDCAEGCLRSVTSAMRETAIRYLGFDPHPPRLG